MAFRQEKDSIGYVDVPAERYWGAQTQRSFENFKIGGHLMPIEIIRAFAILKKAAALTNNEAGILDAEKTNLICQVCDEISEGLLDDEFPLVVWQTGSGTQSNMNLNEVIANRAHVLTGGKLTDAKKILHPNDDVNKSQSSNDTFPTAMSIAAYSYLVKHTIPAIKQLQNTLDKKAKDFVDIVKTGRTHCMDATPLTLGQAFSGFVSQLDHAVRAISYTLPHVAELALGGTAVGTGLNTPPGYSENVAKHIAVLSGLPFITAENKFESLACHDGIVAAHGALKTAAVALPRGDTSAGLDRVRYASRALLAKDPTGTIRCLLPFPVRRTAGAQRTSSSRMSSTVSSTNCTKGRMLSRIIWAAMSASIRIPSRPPVSVAKVSLSAWGLVQLPDWDRIRSQAA